MDVISNQSINRIPEITLLHIMGALMIFMCHCLQQAGNSLSEMFITGTQLFLLVAGYLVGSGEYQDFSFWLKRKFRRILIPYYQVLLVVLVLNFATSMLGYGKAASIYQALVPMFCLQGLQGYLLTVSFQYCAINGIGHLWYITIILICFCLTPIFKKIISLPVMQKNISWFVVVSVLFPCLLFCNIQINYLLMFLLGMYIREQMHRGGVSRRLSTVSMFILLMLRVCLKFYPPIRASWLYERYIVLLFGDAIAIWLFLMVFDIKNRFPNAIRRFVSIKPIQMFDSITYEFYLIHYIVLRGDFAINKFWTGSYISADIIAFLVTIILAFALKISTRFLAKTVLRKVSI